MKTVAWVDRTGFKRVSLLRDEDPDDFVEHGLPLGPPDLSSIDWEDLQREIHNALVDQSMFTWDDLQKAQGNLLGIVCRAVKRRIVNIYRLSDQEVRANGK